MLRFGGTHLWSPKRALHFKYWNEKGMSKRGPNTTACYIKIHVFLSFCPFFPMVCSSSLETRKSLTLTTPGTQCAPPLYLPQSVLRRSDHICRKYPFVIPPSFTTWVSSLSVLIVTRKCSISLLFYFNVIVWAHVEDSCGLPAHAVWDLGKRK